MATLQLFGSDEQCVAAIAMIEEAVDNKEQKQKQRAKEYDKKKEVGGSTNKLTDVVPGEQMHCQCTVAGWWLIDRKDAVRQPLGSRR